MTKAGEQVKDAKDDVEGDVEEKAGVYMAKKLAVPAAVGAGALLVGYAAKKAPGAVRDKVAPKLEEKGADEAKRIGEKAMSSVKDEGGPLGVASKVAEKLPGGGGDDSGKARGYGKGRRLPIQYAIDVAVPAKVAYQAWTDYEKLPEFLHRVESVERQGDGKVVWHENIWGFRRDWTAEIVDESEPKRVAWRSTSRGGNSGVITFHPLSDRLTRVELNMDFQPQGLFEKLSSGLRFHRRAAKSDLKRFKAYVETRDAMGEQQVEGDEPDQATGSGNGRAQRTPSPEELEEARKEREERRKEREQSRSS